MTAEQFVRVRIAELGMTDSSIVLYVEQIARICKEWSDRVCVDKDTTT